MPQRPSASIPSPLSAAIDAERPRKCSWLPSTAYTGLRAVNGFNGETVDALSLHARCPEFGESVGVHLLVYDHDDLRGALKPDRRGRKPRGDLGAVRALLAEA